MQKNKALALLRCCVTISIPFVVVLITVIVIRSCNPVIVSGQSMKPTLNNGELLFGDKSFTVDDLKRGTIIVFKDPADENSSLIKRIVGLPGETVEITGGRIHINGELIQDPSSKAGTAATEPRKLGRPLTLKENEFAVLGDNRGNSFDSRDFGAINFRDIKYIIKRPDL